VKKLICKVCGKEGNKLGIFPKAKAEHKCNQCYMNSRTDLDRTGRSSKKDRYKNKETKEMMY